MDEILRKYLNERGLEERSLSLVHASYRNGRISFPRFRFGYGPQAGADVQYDPIGFKIRDLSTGRFYGEPSGIPHSATHPLVVPTLQSTGVMICEGESDTMRLACTSLPATYNSDVICIPGATAFPSEWVPLLRKYDRVHVFADADEAGKALPNRLASLVPGVRIVNLPRGHDVCSFLLENTEDDLRQLYLIAPIHVAPRSPIRRTAFEWDDAASRDHRDKLTRIVLEDVELRRAGPIEFRGLCPFHEERTPSFNVNPVKGLYRCFGCGAAGDVVTYLKEKRDMTFGQALRYLENM